MTSKLLALLREVALPISYTPVDFVEGPGELPGTIRKAPTPLQDKFAVIVGTAEKVKGKEIFSAVSEPEV